MAGREWRSVEFIATDDSDPELSTLASYADNDHFASVRRTAPRIAVETLSLNDMLALHDAPREIGYMSVDTEGSEYESWSPSTSSVTMCGLFSIEHNNSPTEVAIQTLLAVTWLCSKVSRVLAVGRLVRPRLTNRKSRGPAARSHVAFPI